MAKKQKRQSKPVASHPEKVETSTGRPVVSTGRPGSSAEFNPDYSYVRADLKKIGILAVSFTAILIALSFILK
ncbi:MAG: hypothetical protein IT308_01495 [Anaerolineaceae bacterium]|nr:hypothetical protein [Anaerolineaceae bacterium]